MALFVSDNRCDVERILPRRGVQATDNRGHFLQRVIWSWPGADAVYFPIDRLEEKVKRLVGMVDRMKAEHTRAAEENLRLTRELDAMRAHAAASDGLVAELSSLKEERDVIRTRVTDMLEQLEALNL